MTAEAEAQGAEGKTEKKRSPVMLIAIIAALVLLLGGGAGFYFLVMVPGQEAAKKAEEEAKTFIFNLPTMTVNLKTEDGVPAFIRLTVAFEVANPEVMKEIQTSLAKVMDAFQVYMRELRRSDLEGSAGIYRLKEELRRRINVAVYPAEVDSILFKEILVQ